MIFSVCSWDLALVMFRITEVFSDILPLLLILMNLSVNWTACQLFDQARLVATLKDIRTHARTHADTDHLRPQFPDLLVQTLHPRLLTGVLRGARLGIPSVGGRLLPHPPEQTLGGLSANFHFYVSQIWNGLTDSALIHGAEGKRWPASLENVPSYRTGCLAYATPAEWDCASGDKQSDNINAIPPPRSRPESGSQSPLLQVKKKTPSDFTSCGSLVVGTSGPAAVSRWGSLKLSHAAQIPPAWWEATSSRKERRALRLSSYHWSHS